MGKFKNDTVKIGVFYESPKRIEDTLNIINESLPNAKLCLCNDLTKKFERVYRGKTSEVLEMIKDNEKSELGEYALVIEYEKEVEQKAEGFVVSLEARIFDKVLSGLDIKSAVKELQKEGVARNDAYEAGLRVKGMLN